MRQWHWISAAVCLIGMLLFAITGITLNHASQIESKPSIVGAQRDSCRPTCCAQVKAEKGAAETPAAGGVARLDRATRLP